jgi:hypothetical protein
VCVYFIETSNFSFSSKQTYFFTSKQNKTNKLFFHANWAWTKNYKAEACTYALQWSW